MRRVNKVGFVLKCFGNKRWNQEREFSEVGFVVECSGNVRRN